MLEGYSVEELDFLRWAMESIQDNLGELGWRDYVLVLIVLGYLVESGLYVSILDESDLFDPLSVICRNKEGCEFAV